MKAERINNKKFDQIEIKITIETERELEAMDLFFSNTSALQKSEFLNLHLNGGCAFNGDELLFMESLCHTLK